MCSKTKPIIYITIKRLPEAGVQILREQCDVRQWNEDDAVDEKTLSHQISDADGLFCCSLNKINRSIIESAGNTTATTWALPTVFPTWQL